MTGATGKVIDGQVLHHGQVILEAPRQHRPRWPWVLSVAWVLLVGCLSVPAVVLVTPVMRGTVDAGRGATSPLEALVLFVYTFEDKGRDGEINAGRVIIKSQRSKILKARRDFLNAQAEDLRRHPDWSWGPLSTSGPPNDSAEPERYETNGDRATLVQYWSVSGRITTSTSPGSARGSDVWRAEVRQERDGWRLWSVTIPPWCGGKRADGTYYGYSKC